MTVERADPSATLVAMARVGGGRRRWPWITGGVVVALVAVAAATWFWYLPNHRSDLRAGERYGIDVSRHQELIAWERVAEDDIDFAYIKASEGGDLVDERFAENWFGAGEAGIDLVPTTSSRCAGPAMSRPPTS